MGSVVLWFEITGSTAAMGLGTTMASLEITDAAGSRWGRRRASTSATQANSTAALPESGTPDRRPSDQLTGRRPSA